MATTIFNYNNSYAIDNATYYESLEYHKRRRLAVEYDQIRYDRAKFPYVYHAFAACKVILNLLEIVTIIYSRKRKCHFRNWLIIHVMCRHLLFGGVALPYIGKSFEETRAGLKSVPLCKFLEFLSYVIEYMSNISVSGKMISSRLLRSVSIPLSVSVLIILPWFTVIMLSAVLILTMSEEQYGKCYIISEESAQIVWLTMAFCVRLTIVLASFVTIVYLLYSQSLNDRVSNGRHLPYLCVLLRSVFFLTDTIFIAFFQPLRKNNITKHGLVLIIMTHGFYTARLSSMIIIPIAYLIPMEFKKYYRRLKSKLVCKTVKCNTNNTKKPQSMELVAVSHTERTIV